MVKVPFKYIGSKSKYLKDLLDVFPNKINADKFVDVFGGCAVVVMNVDYNLRVYNDIDCRLVNFFRVARDMPDELIRVLSLTPYSRYEYKLSYEISDDSLEDARRVFSHYQQSLYGGANSKTWASRFETKMKSGSDVFYEKRNSIQDICSALKGINIECLDFEKVIEMYDGERTVVYLDPPYVKSTISGRHYKNEMNDNDHVRLHRIISSARSMCIVSGYPSELYSDLYKSWNMICFRNRKSSVGRQSGVKKRAEKPEVVWTNFAPRQSMLNMMVA